MHSASIRLVNRRPTFSALRVSKHTVLNPFHQLRHGLHARSGICRCLLATQGVLSQHRRQRPGIPPSCRLELDSLYYAWKATISGIGLAEKGVSNSEHLAITPRDQKRFDEVFLKQRAHVI